VRASTWALAGLALFFAACEPDSGEYANPKNVRILALEGGAAFDDGSAVQTCVDWSAPVCAGASGDPYGTGDRRPDCVCARYRIESARGFAFSFDGEAELGAPLSTANGRLEISSGEATIVLTKRQRVSLGGGAYYTSYAGTLEGTFGQHHLARGVFY
jgi:hypothetical protein